MEAGEGGCQEGGGWLQAVVEILPVGLCRVDPEGRCLYVNGSWMSLAGISARQARENGWESAIHPADRRRVRAEWSAMTQFGWPFHSEYRFLHSNGRVVWVVSRAVECRNAAGDLDGYVGTVTDVSELRQMREELQQSRSELAERVRVRSEQIHRMAMVVENSDDAVYSTDNNGFFLNWNKAAETLFGYSAEEVIGKMTASILVPPNMAAEAQQFALQVRAGGSVHRHETFRMTRGGQLIEVALSLFPLRSSDGQLLGTSAILRDITALKGHERRLHQLSWRLMRIQDEERRRIARELHDSTAQLLAALTMNLAVLSNGEARLPKARREAILKDSTLLAQDAARELRSHSYLLHPPMLDEQGLGAALRCYIEGFSSRSGIATECDIDPRIGRLPDEIELTLFRVVQESLTNVMRHAQSPTAALALRLAPNSILLEVRDAGRGLALGAADKPGVGIPGMTERLHQLGGTLTVESSPGGTTVRAQLPYAHEYPPHPNPAS